jgi:predicted ArsR family transcriptional regulator
MVQGKRTITDDEIVERMRAVSDPAFTTSELASEFGLTTEGIRGRLKQLESEDRIQSKKPSSRTVIWWVEDSQSVVCST